MSPSEREKYGAQSFESLSQGYEALYRAAEDNKQAASESRQATRDLMEAFSSLSNSQTAPRLAAPPSSPSVSSEPPVRIVEHLQPRSSLGLPDPSTLRALRDFLNKDSASFSCPEQALALDLAIRRCASFFIVGPTGMGKNCIYLIAALLRPHLVTIVVIPLSGLRIDFALRCAHHSIQCDEWTRTSPPDLRSTIVMVSPENVALALFSTWAKHLELSGLLNLIVYDEVHLIKTHASFRDCFSYSSRLTAIGKRILATRTLHTLTSPVVDVPTIYATATFPSDLADDIITTFSLKHCRIIRALTTRPEISYRVTVHPDERTADAALCDELRTVMAHYQPREKALVFCRSRDEADRMADALHCKSFHSDIPQATLEQTWDWFTNTPDPALLVCTSIIGVGVDIPHVRDVFHWGKPYDLLSYAQESGRAGRDKRPAFSRMHTWKDELRVCSNYTEDHLNRLIPQVAECRRTILGEVLDNHPTSCALLQLPNLCDNCERRVSLPHPLTLDPRAPAPVGSNTAPSPLPPAPPPSPVTHPHPPGLPRPSSSVRPLNRTGHHATASGFSREFSSPATSSNRPVSGLPAPVRPTESPAISSSVFHRRSPSSAR